MRWFVGTLLFISFLLIGGYIFAKGYPYRVYLNWIKGQEFNKYYSITKYKSFYLKPLKIAEIPPYKEDYSQLWKKFPLQNTKIPLPVRHPLFQTIPLVESTGEKSPPQFGITILSPNARELSSVYTLPGNLEQDHSQGQDLFKLPFVRNKILKFPLEKLWQDVFSFQIQPHLKSINEMIYDLYVLHIRSKILPSGTLRYGLITDKKALIEIASKDKDYMIELVITYDSGSLYSFILKTEKNNGESLKLRAKFLNEISFGPIDPAMGNILYTEFKQLNFARQVDQEGMLYLFSAWSQEIANVEMLKEMIFYLERGKAKGLQLRPLYAYAMKQYGKTFTKKRFVDNDNDPNISLQRRIEIESIENKQNALKERSRPPAELELTPDEKMNLYLKQAKEKIPAKKEDMTIH